MELEGEPLIKILCRRLAPRFEQTLISANDTGKFAFLGVPVVPDRIPSQGPLMAIASALAASRHDLNFVVACDIPDPDLGIAGELLQLAGDHDAVVPIDSGGRLQPLFAVYNRKILPALEKALRSGARRVMDALDGCDVLRHEPASMPPLVNLNTSGDWDAYKSKRTASS
jgi:molybdopterin-guanine dinucleotide biosynthesis protein A